jgi:hypothetical protein
MAKIVKTFRIEEDDFKIIETNRKQTNLTLTKYIIKSLKNTKIYKKTEIEYLNGVNPVKTILITIISTLIAFIILININLIPAGVFAYNSFVISSNHRLIDSNNNKYMIVENKYITTKKNKSYIYLK